jgi:hypothetical protein
MIVGVSDVVGVLRHHQVVPVLHQRRRRRLGVRLLVRRRSL